jgi:hypothetical protein
MFQTTRIGVSVPQIFMESGSSAQLLQNPINEPYRSQLSQLILFTHLLLCFAILFSHANFYARTVNEFLVYPSRASFPTCLTLFDAQP